MSYPAYPEMKPSGVEWLGDVPKHWNTKRLQYCARLVNDKLDAVPEKVAYIGLENVDSGTGRQIFSDEKQIVDGACSIFQRGDVLFGKLRPYLAKAVHVETSGACTGELLVLRPYYEGRFLLYSLLSDGFIKEVDSSTYGAKMPRASWDFIGQVPMVMPPLPEQQAIAAFLDRKTAALDAVLRL